MTFASIFGKLVRVVACTCDIMATTESIGVAQQFLITGLPGVASSEPVLLSGGMLAN